MKNISILGATGSIGTQTLDVIRKSEGAINLVAVSANSSVKKIIDIIEEFSPKYVAMMDKKAYKDIKEYCSSNNKNISVYSGIDGLIKVASLDEIDTVVTSVVGMIGLKPTIAAIEAKKDIALANKETLVVAGEIVMRKAKENGVKILPVDSEHSAIFQSLSGYCNKDIHKIILTASGGPFRGKKIDDLKDVTVHQALKHPKWNMGQKISIDSATLMNKDASVIAQMGSPDMRLPIQYALNYPKREGRIANPISFYEIAQLTFEKPDMDTFKCLKLAFKAGKAGGLMPTILNGANEEAVALLLEEKIKFLDIADLIEECMDKFKDKSNMELTIDNIIAVDQEVREYLRKKVS